MGNVTARCYMDGADATHLLRAKHGSKAYAICPLHAHQITAAIREKWIAVPILSAPDLEVLTALQWEPVEANR